MNKKLTAKIQKLIPSLGENEAIISSSIAIEPPERELVLKKGNVYTVFDVRSAVPISVSLITNVINDVLYDSYYHSDNVSPIQSLEKAIVNINEKVSNLGDSGMQEDATSEQNTVKFNILAAVLWGNVLYVVQYGDGKSFLMRDGEIKEVSSTSEGNFSVASGVVRSDDVIVISTKHFSEKFPPEKLLDTAIASTDLEPDQSSMVLKFSIDAEFTNDEMIDFNLPKEKHDSKFSQVVDTLKSRRAKKERKVEPITSLTDDIQESKPTQDPMNKPVPADIPKTKPQKEKPKMPEVPHSDGETVDVPEMKPLPPLPSSMSNSNVQIRDESKFKFTAKTAMILVAVLLVVSVFGTVLVKNNSLRDSASDNESGDGSALTVPNELNKQEQKEEVKPSADELAQTDLEKQKSEDATNGVSRVDAQPFYDIKLADENADPTNIAVFNNTVVVTDPASGKIFSSSASTPKFTALEKTFPGIENAVNYDGDLYFSDDVGFKIYDLVADEVKNSYEGTFGVTNVYLGNIYSVGSTALTKHTTSDDSLEETTWGESTSFANTTSVAIAYSIYTVTSSGDLNVYTQGDQADFDISGLNVPLKNPTEIVAGNDFDYIYIADAGNQRIVVIDSDGSFIRQIKTEKAGEWDDIRSISVSPDEATLFVLNGTRVFDVDLTSALAVEEVEEEVVEETPEEEVVEEETAPEEDTTTEEETVPEE